MVNCCFTRVRVQHLPGPQVVQHQQRCVVHDLPEDLMIDILSRMPAESVLNCRTVCKKWLTLTSSPHFAKMHMRRQVPVLFVQTKLYECSEFEESSLCIVDHHPIEGKTLKAREGSMGMLHIGKSRLCGSCDGLLVFRIEMSRYLVCNPVTREHVIVERPTPGEHREYPRYPHNSRIGEYRKYCGIYHHSGIGEYLLVFWGIAPCDEYELYTFGISSKLWRKCPTISPYHPQHGVSPIILNERLHWIAENQRLTPPCTKSIFSCDMDVQDFRYMPHPGGECMTSFFHEGMYLLEMKGLLALGQFDSGDASISIYILEDYEAWSWVHKFKFCVWKFVRKPSRIWECLTSFPERSGVVSMRIQDCELFFYWDGQGLFGYNLVQKTCRKFRVPNVRKREMWCVKQCFSMLPYTKTFISWSG